MPTYLVIPAAKDTTHPAREFFSRERAEQYAARIGGTVVR
jgi:hypothetical protein